MSDGNRQELIAAVAYDVVARCAPHELPLFRAMSAAYFRDAQGAGAGQSTKDSMLGFGLGEVVTLLSPAILIVVGQVVTFLSTTIRQSIEAQGAEAIERVVKGMFKRFQPAEPESPPLTAEQLAQVRKVALEKAAQLRLAPQIAALLADSVVGSLAVAIEEQELPR